MDLDNLKLILVPTDFSQASETALGVAVQLARTFHATIEIFPCRHRPDPGLAAPGGRHFHATSFRACPREHR
jgi:nucleotide-binding universal stress UspA family protein